METTQNSPTIGMAVAGRIAGSIERDGVARTAGRLSKALVLFGFCAAVVAPQLAMGYAAATIAWKGAALIKIGIVIGAFMHYKNMLKLWSWIKRRAHRDPEGNQHTYHGIPIEQMTDYLIEHAGFPREDAIKHFGISRKRQFKMADELEKHHILERGESNGRVLNAKLTREQLVRQLRDGFPLAWSESLLEWGERKGAFETWILKKDQDARKDQQSTERLERKVARLQDKREELEEELAGAPGFIRRELALV